MLPGLDVSRETIEKLKIYETLLLKWQPHLNLISKTTLGTIWHRHFLDSAQLYSLISDPNLSICDLGSGGGFPGAVLAIMGCENVTLIERDRKKSSFLRNVSRETKTVFSVFEGDVADYSEKADIITSRALASVGEILKLSQTLLKPNTHCFFLKGKNFQKELDALPSNISIKIKIHPSLTSTEGSILEIKSVLFL